MDMPLPFSEGEQRDFEEKLQRLGFDDYEIYEMTDEQYEDLYQRIMRSTLGSSDPPPQEPRLDQFPVRPELERPLVREPMDDPKKTFVLKELRKMVGLNQKRLADEIGVSLSTISKWEQGAVEPRGMSLQELIRWFNSIDWWQLGSFIAIVSARHPLIFGERKGGAV